MSRLPSFFTVSSGNAQLLQNVLIPRACNSSRNNQTFWGARADLSNIGTLYATTVVASNFSGGTAGINTDEAKGTIYMGAGSSNGVFPTGQESNIAAYGTKVLGGYGNPTYLHGTICNVVGVGATALEGASNVRDSVFIGTLAGQQATVVSNTVAIGNQAAIQATGSNNVYIGTKSGYIGTGSGNVFIGHEVGSTDTTTANTLYIGNRSGTYLLRGDFANGKLGVNRTPASNFDVSGTTYLRSTTRIDSNLGLNRDPQYPFDVSGDTRLRGNVIIDGDLTVSGGPIGSDVCTGQVILGIGASSRDYPSLIGIKGGIQLSDGFIQLNRMDTRDPLYRLDVSASARISGGSLIGGVTLSGTNVTTTGNVSISGYFSNIATSTNTIGGLTISSGNLVTTGTISGLFRNASNTSNSIGGVTLSRGELYDISYMNIGGNIGIGGSNSLGGTIRLNNPAVGSGFTALAELNSIDQSAGNLLLKNSNGNTTLTISGSSGRISNDPASSNYIGGVTLCNCNVELKDAVGVKVKAYIGACNGELTLHNSNADPMVKLNGGSDGASPGSGYFVISNSAAEKTFEVLGGLGDMTIFSNNIATFDVDGTTGRVSNKSSETSYIGGVTLGPNGLITASYGAISNASNTNNYIGGVRIGSNGQPRLLNVLDITFSNTEPTLFVPGGLGYFDILKFLLLGEVYDSTGPSRLYTIMYSPGIQSFGPSGNMNRADSIYLRPRVRVNFYDSNSNYIASAENRSTYTDTYLNLCAALVNRDNGYMTSFV